MKKTRVNPMVEYIPSMLILSYFIFHNIFLVLISIIFSFYLINIDMIDNIKKSIINNLTIKKESKASNKNIKKIKSNTINIKSTKEDNKLTLVEEIEESGFIPSIDKNNNTNAA